MSSSNSNLPAIILVVAGIIALGAFYYADRSSSSTTDIAAMTDHADVESMAKSREKYEANKSAFSHSGFSGTAQEYLSRFSGGVKAPAKDIQAHSGYSGAASDYVEKYASDELKQLEENVKDNSGFSGSMKDYAAGNYDKRSAPSKMSSSAESSSSKDTQSHSGYSGSMEDYAAGDYKKSSSGSESMSNSGYQGNVKDYLKKYK